MSSQQPPTQAPSSSSARTQVQMRQQPTSRHTAMSMVPASYQSGTSEGHRDYLASFTRGGTSSTVTPGTRKSSDPKGRVPINLGKSGSQISHTPTEPVIKEDEDESSESSAGGPNGVATITHLPIIGGAPLAQSPLPPVDEGAAESKPSVSVTPEREHK
ncbi:hypothetical protein TELCIR_10864 [Teladorsagia circumcincta]|uniref:Uncharacterized protein n=1 Tax=Teladorsagia circumcincta TaxID=45464 RepID=A0A2G9UAZ6_TELCI|nr:hypothetical protein TELCIR_10864 [Teladorsagia circumcincta]